MFTTFNLCEFLREKTLKNTLYRFIFSLSYALETDPCRRPGQPLLQLPMQSDSCVCNSNIWNSDREDDREKCWVGQLGVSAFCQDTTLASFQT